VQLRHNPNFKNHFVEQSFGSSSSAVNLPGWSEIAVFDGKVALVHVATKNGGSWRKPLRADSAEEI
jgi:hypothetical protein